jgi:peptidyl-tRNA hydrolase
MSNAAPSIEPAPDEPGPGVSGHDDPQGEAPWAMPIVVRVEKGAEPDAAAVAEAIGIAVARLLDDPRVSDSGEWADAMRRWLDGRIRKVARRARGARWEAVQNLPGLTVSHRGAQARAFVPTSTAAVPPEIAKLQVSGLKLPDGAPSAPRPDALPVALTPHVTMSPLKAAVQVAHATQLARTQLARTAMGRRDLKRWRASGFDVRLVRPDAATWARLASSAKVVVRDAGFTEIPPGTRTTVALWRGWRSGDEVGSA